MGDTSCIDKQIWNFDVACSPLEIKGLFGNVFGKSFFFLNIKHTVWKQVTKRDTFQTAKHKILFNEQNTKYFSKNITLTLFRKNFPEIFWESTCLFCQMQTCYLKKVIFILFYLDHSWFFVFILCSKILLRFFAF